MPSFLLLIVVLPSFLLLIVVLPQFHLGGIMHRAELFLTNGTVVTLDPHVAEVDSVVIGGGLVLDVGTRRKLRHWITAETHVVDLGGATVFPGFHDAHGHIVGYALSCSQADLVGATSELEVIARTSRFAGTLPPNSPISGRGWDQNLWQNKTFPTHHLLSEQFGDRPVALGRIDGHALLVNRWILDRLGISRSTADPVGGLIVRDAAGDATGVLVDRAMDVVGKLFPPPDETQLLHLISSALKRLSDLGLTTVHDMGIDPLSYRLLRLLEQRDGLPIRIVGYLDIERYGDIPITSYPPPSTNDDVNGRFFVKGVKFYQDGALGSRGAALCTCYHDEPGASGLLFYDAETLRDRLTQVNNAGYQTAIHAIGDRAVHVVLDVLQSLTVRDGSPVWRPRIEHAQIVAEDDVHRFASLGVIASVQPQHAVSDRAWAPDRIGCSRIENAYLARRFVETGVLVALGSDFPIESPDPWRGWLAATRRVDLDGLPPGGFRATECLTPLQAIRGVTTTAAFAAGMTDSLGAISSGKWADLTILSDNPLKTADDSLDPWRVIGTVVGGRLSMKL